VALSVNQLLNGNTTLAPVATDVQVIVHQGVVSLRGTVPTEHDRKAIVQNVSKLAGVARVDDQLKVTG
jgi:osmotically-inducible protein OsmY